MVTVLSIPITIGIIVTLKFHKVFIIIIIIIIVIVVLIVVVVIKLIIVINLCKQLLKPHDFLEYLKLWANYSY